MILLKIFNWEGITVSIKELLNLVQERTISQDEEVALNCDKEMVEHFDQGWGHILD